MENKYKLIPSMILLVGCVDEGLQEVVALLTRVPAFLDGLEEHALDLPVIPVPPPAQPQNGPPFDQF